MKYFILVAAAYAAVANAQANPSACLPIAAAIPSCGVPCITSAASKVNCGTFDFECQCSSANNAQIQSLAQACVISACTPVAQALSVQAAASSVCACAATAAANVGGGSSTTSGSSSATSMSASAGGTSSGSSAATSSMSGSMSMSTPATTSSAALAGSSSGSGSGNATTTTIGPATTETFSRNGAALAVGSIGGLAAALLGAIAYL